MTHQEFPGEISISSLESLLAALRLEEDLRQILAYDPVANTNDVDEWQLSTGKEIEFALHLQLISQLDQLRGGVIEAHHRPTLRPLDDDSRISAMLLKLVLDWLRRF